MELFLIFIFYQYNKIAEEHLRENLFLEMKNYSFFFDDERFEMDIVSTNTNQKPYELYEDEASLFILVPMPGSIDDSLKVYYSKYTYLLRLNEMQRGILFQFLFLSFLSLLIALFFSFYTLSPLRKSLALLETFIKDIIHDLNTPITSILINLKMMDAKNEEVESIARSTKTISMLHHNLNAYLDQSKHENERFSLKEVIKEQVDFFSSMYDYIEWNVTMDTLILHTDKHAFSRIVYNLLSNACKYNTPDGFIDIACTNKTLIIQNKSYGIKNPSKVFNRFYKESERGLGIGLHIVEMLCNTLHIEKRLQVQHNIVKVTLELTEVTLD